MSDEEPEEQREGDEPEAPPPSPPVADPPMPAGTPTREPGHGGYAVPPKWY